MVGDGLVRREDKEGNDAADVASNFGGLRHLEVAIGARRNLLRVLKEWYPRMLVLHRFMVAIAGEALNHGDGSLVDPLVWDKRSKTQVRKIDTRLIHDLACLPGPPGFLDTNWITVDPGPLTKGDTSKWPYSVPILVKIVAFLSTLRWPEGLNDMGKFGISYFELCLRDGLGAVFCLKRRCP